MLGGVLHHVLDGVLPPVTDPAEELHTVGPPQLLPLNPELVDLQVVQHQCSVREQNVEIAKFAVDQITEEFQSNKWALQHISKAHTKVNSL